MNEIIKPAGVLLIITAVAAMLLGFVSETTKGPIAEQGIKTEQAAMSQTLPGDGLEFETVLDTAAGDAADGTITKVAKATKDGETYGFVITANPGGFSGPVSTMIGIDAEGVITGLRVLAHSETPGLGAVATDPSFYEQFTGKSGEVKVTKDGGEINAITSATITSRAVSGGATEALDWVAANGGAN